MYVQTVAVTYIVAVNAYYYVINVMYKDYIK